MKVKSEIEVAQSDLTLHDPTDCSLPGSSVHGISQARVLELVAIAFSQQGGKHKRISVRVCRLDGGDPGWAGLVSASGRNHLSQASLLAGGGSWQLCYLLPVDVLPGLHGRPR